MIQTLKHKLINLLAVKWSCNSYLYNQCIKESVVSLISSIEVLHDLLSATLFFPSWFLMINC